MAKGNVDVAANALEVTETTVGVFELVAVVVVVDGSKVATIGPMHAAESVVARRGLFIHRGREQAVRLCAWRTCTKDWVQYLVVSRERKESKEVAR